MTTQFQGDPGARSGVKAVLSAAEAADKVIEHGRNLQAAIDEIRALAQHWTGPATGWSQTLRQAGNRVNNILEGHGV